jgi:hypothetical protein
MAELVELRFGPGREAEGMPGRVGVDEAMIRIGLEVELPRSGGQYTPLGGVEVVD